MYNEGSIARIRTSGLFHSDEAITEDDCADPYHSGIDLGIETVDEMDAAFENILEQADANGVGGVGMGHLCCLLDEYSDVFTVRLGPDPVADVEPMKVHLRPDSVP